MSTEAAVNSSVAPSADPLPDVASSSQGEDAGAALLVREESETPASPSSPLSPDSPLAGLPLQLDVTVPIAAFRVEDLLALEKGRVLETQWAHDEDVPVWCGGAQLAWTEFEVVDQKLAVRVTRIS